MSTAKIKGVMENAIYLDDSLQLVFAEDSLSCSICGKTKEESLWVRLVFRYYCLDCFNANMIKTYEPSRGRVCGYCGRGTKGRPQIKTKQPASLYLGASWFGGWYGLVCHDRCMKKAHRLVNKALEEHADWIVAHNL